MLGLCRAHVGSIVGSMLSHVGPMLRPCRAYGEACWAMLGHVEPLLSPRLAIYFLGPLKRGKTGKTQDSRAIKGPPPPAKVYLRTFGAGGFLGGSLSTSKKVPPLGCFTKKENEGM